MSDFTETKPALGGLMPVNAVATAWDESEPLIGPKQLISLHLRGLPLVSAIKDPRTKQFVAFDDPDYLQAEIKEAVGLAELEGGFDIFQKHYKERRPYDLPEQNKFGFIQVDRRPVASIESLAIVSSDGVKVWDVPLNWIETGLIQGGQINLVPFAVASQSGITIPVTSPVGMGLLPSLFKFNWVPSLWMVEYTTGFKDGQLPVQVNHLIGVIAAMEVLSKLAATFSRANSMSLGIDGLSQSISTPGPELYLARLKELSEKRRWLIKKLQRQWQLGLLVNNV